VAGASLGCSDDSITDLNAPPGLELTLTPSLDTIFITSTIAAAPPVLLGLSATSMSRPVVAPSGVEWTSSNPAVAVVSSGLVTAVGTGTAIVTARVNSDRATMTVVVALGVIHVPLKARAPSPQAVNLR
jgi:hypothetical protein